MFQIQREVTQGYCFTTLPHLLPTASRLLTRIKKAVPIRPYLATSHLLPVNFKIDFQNVLISHTAVNGRAPAYISKLLCPDAQKLLSAV